jgi:hypothetical protein
MTTETKTPNPVIAIDGLVDLGDVTASPIRGLSARFKDGDYFSFADKLDVKGEQYAVTGRTDGWQKLEKDCSPEFLMRVPGQPRPPQPVVAKENWPLNLNGVPEHPWRLTRYAYLINVATGEIMTFSSSTVGGRIALDMLSDQVRFMRNHNPNAVPVIELQSRDMPTQFGGTKPRPHFQIVGWRELGAGSQGPLSGPEVTSPSIAEEMNDALPDFTKPAAVKSDTTNKKKGK